MCDGKYSFIKILWLREHDRGLRVPFQMLKKFNDSLSDCKCTMLGYRDNMEK